MKKIFKRTLSILLVLVMLFSALPITVFAEDTTEIESTGNDVSVEATNSFGEMVASELNNVEADPEAPYYISEMEFEGSIVKVDFYNETECKLVVAVYDEKTMQMLASEMVDVDAEAKTCSLEFEESLPEYFVAKAYLLGENNEGLCKAFTSNKNTTEFKEFMSKTTEDFSENIVINLDESVDNNFLVMNDDGQSIAGDEETNVLVEQDLENNRYVFENIDDEIKSLKAGDTFYLDNGDETNLVVIKVASIKIDGTTATIISETVELEDVFDYVKIDSQCLTTEFEYDGTNKDPDVEYLGEDTSKIPSSAVDEETSVDLSKKFKIEEKKLESADGKASVTFSCTITFNVNCAFKIYISAGYKEVSLVITPQVIISAGVSGKIDVVNIELGNLDAMPVPGVFVGIEPTFVVRVSGELSVSGTLSFAVGAGWTNDDGFVNKCEKPTFKPEIKVEASLFIGFDMKPRIFIAHEKALKLELSGVVGAEISAKDDTSAYTPSDDITHTCAICLDGDIDGKLEISARVVVGEDTWIEKEASVSLINLTVEICEFYYSHTYGEFAFTSCPHKLYKVTFVVYDNSGNPVSGASVMGTTTDANGKAYAFLADGKYSYTVTYKGVSKSGEVKVKDGTRKVTVTLNASSSSSGTTGGLTGNEQQGDIIEFGSYPQTLVTGYALKSNLNLLDKTWYSYDYYISGEQSDYMKYCDVEYKGEKYRGVKFTSYRPYYTTKSSSASYSYQDENGYHTSTTYWFKYEPLEWRVLHPEAGIVMCESLIDSQPFHYTDQKTNGYYANNYAESYIRDWLINDFYDLAFTSTEKSMIGLTTCSNYCPFDGYSQYDSDETIDPVFLLSYDEVTEAEFGFSSSKSSSSTRYAQGTDYAKCQGLWVSTSSSYYGNSCWRLRSPDGSSYGACEVRGGGYVYSYCYVAYTSYGVRPALRFNLESSIFESYSEEVYANGAAEDNTVTHFDISEDACVAGRDYMLYNVTGYTAESFSLTEDNLLYIDQLTADENGKINTAFLPKAIDESSTTFIVGDFGNGIETKVLTAHSYSQSVTEPACTENGFTTYTCKICGDYYTADFVEAIGHSWSEWTETDNPEIKVRMCSICKTTETETTVTDGIKAVLTDTDGNVIDERIIDIASESVTFDDIPDGEYTVILSKENYVTREYSLTATDGKVTTAFALNLLGDLTGDGKVNTIDVARANSHAKGVSALSDYSFECADVNGDGKVNTIDVARMNSHAKSVTTLW